MFAGSVAFLAWQKPDEFSRIVYENPWLMDETATILPWALQSATFTVASLTPFGRPGVIALTEGHWPATTYREAVEGTLAMLENAGAVSGDGSFHLGDPYVRQDTPDRLYADNALQTLMGAHDMDDEAAPEDPYAQIQIMDVLDDHGQIVGHVVQIPGTEDWSTHRTVNPSDAYGCLTAAAQRQTMMQDMAEEAMRKHGVTGDVPVMITGHSQGGMNAAALASDPDFVGRYNVTNLLTGGSPTGRFDIDPRVQALLIENTPDPVPYLDAADNPDRDNMTTVQYDLPPVDATPNPVEAHRLSSYEEVARLADQSHHPSIDRWREQAGPLLDGTGLRTTTYKILPDEPPLPIEPSHGRSGTVLGHPASPPAEPGYGYGSPYDKR
ncbi:MAG: hypothetical protein CSA58_00080 [Micrococcales bacterium]|nr:MAG: hypothetical protein CSA58_00080 [Micrococcales bacterium]